MPDRCLVCVLCTILLSFVVSAGLAVLTVWLVFRPSQLKVHVEAAALTHFNLPTPSNHLSYNLSLDVSIRSPNERLSIYYDSVEAVALYDGHQFGRDDRLPSFFQDVKNTTMVYPKFDGRRTLVEEAVQTFRREEEEGWFHVEVKIYTRVRFKAWFVKTNKYKPKFTCDLRLHAPDPPGGKGQFNRTRCDVDIF